MGAPRIDKLDKNFFINSALEYWQRVAGNLTTINQSGGINFLAADRVHAGSTGPTVKNYSVIRSSDIPHKLLSNSFRFNCLTAISSPAAADYVVPFSIRMEGRDARNLYSKKITIGVWVKLTAPGATFPLQTSIVINRSAESPVRTYAHPVTINTNAAWQWVQFSVELEGGTTGFDNALALEANFGASGGVTNQASTVNAWINNYAYYSPGDFNMMSNNGNILQFAMPTLVLGEAELDGNTLIMAGRNLTEELILCQRYFEKSYNVGNALNSGDGAGKAFWVAGGGGGTEVDTTHEFLVQKRTNPTISFFETVAFATGPTVQRSGQRSFAINGTTVGSFSNFEFHWSADAEL